MSNPTPHNIPNFLTLPQNPELSNLILQDWQEFLAEVEKGKEEKAFAYERRLQQSLEALKGEAFEGKWLFFKQFLATHYSYTELNLPFYESEWEELKGERKVTLENGNSLQNKWEESVEILQTHLLQSWQKALKAKELREESRKLEEEKEVFQSKIKAKITQFEMLEEALEEVTQDVKQLWDLSESTWEMGDFKEFEKYAAFLQKDKELQELAELLGNLRNSSRKTFEMVPIPNAEIRYAVKSSITGVRLGDDLGSLLPSEVALLADEAMEDLFIKRLADKKLQCYDYQTNLLDFQKTFRREQPDLEKGPFILCLDTSGSMEGMPEMVAKALTLAIIRMAVRTNRRCYLIAFSNQIETLEISNLASAMPQLLRFLKHAFRGGTDLTPAIEEALKMLALKHYEKADILLISDFLLPKLHHHTLAAIQVVKNSKTKLYSLLISKHKDFVIPPSLSELLDRVWRYDSEGIVEIR